MVKEIRTVILLVLALLLLAGCASSHIATDVGGKIGDSYANTAKKGIPTAEETVKAWPYISGLIKGLLAEDFETHVTYSLKFVLARLDELAKKETLTEEEKGLVVGYTVRLETLAGKEFWDRYGAGFFSQIKIFAGGVL